MQRWDLLRGKAGARGSAASGLSARWLRNRWVLAVGVGLVWSLAFPPADWAWAGWCVGGLLAAGGFGLSPRERFRWGYLAGLAHYLSSLYWLLEMPSPLGALAGWLALGMYLAIYPGLWVWWIHAWRRTGSAPVREGELGVREWVAATHWWERQAWAMCAAAGWVAWEMLVSHLFTGFPWNLLGVSQHAVLPLIQLASVTGVSGISFLLVWMSVGAGLAVGMMLARPGRVWGWLGEMGFPLLVLAGVSGFGLRELARPEVAGRTIQLALVQPSIPQTLIWDPAADEVRFNKILRLSEAALHTEPDVLVWPEASVPNLLRFDPAHYRAITNMLAGHRTWMILGADDAEPRVDTPDPNDADYYNSSFLLDPQGRIRATYRKQHLVMFGEYVPWSKWLPFLKYLTPIDGNLQPGRGPVPFILKHPDADTSVLICFEDTLPELARRAVGPHTDFLLNLTNDGWFGQSAAQWQHAINACFRAVENRVPLVRCTNNGLTCWIGPYGRWHDVYYGKTRDIYGAGFKTVRVPLLPEGETRAPTIYRRYGDWFGWGCLALGLFLSGFGLVRRVGVGPSL